METAQGDSRNEVHQKTDMAMKLGAARQQASSAWRLIKIQIAEPESDRSFKSCLQKKKLRQVRRREGRYLLRSNLTGEQPQGLCSANPWRAVSS